MIKFNLKFFLVLQAVAITILNCLYRLDPILLICIFFLIIISYWAGLHKGAQNSNRRLTQNELLIEELQFRLNLILNFSKIGIWVLDVKTKELNWNKEMFAIYDLDSNLKPCQNMWSKCLVPDDLLLTLPLLENSILKTEEFNTSFRIVTANKGIRHIKSIGNFLMDKEGEAYKMVGINYDNTSEEVFKSNILSLNKELLDFTSILSHDLQQPTTIASMYLDLLGGKNPNLDSDSKEYFNYVKSSLNEISCILQDLIELIRIDSQEKEQQSSNKILTNVINFKEILNSITYDPNRVEIDLPATAIKIAMYNRDIKSLFTNLLSNSIKFSSQNKKNLIKVDYSLDNHLHKFIISDTGIGIEPRHLDEIIKPFFRVYSSEDYPGTGLGLSLCDKIIKKYKGTLTIKSILGVGTSITITLPDHNTI